MIHNSKNGVIIVVQKPQDNQNKPQKHREPNNYFYQYMRKDKNLPNKNNQSNNSSGKSPPDSYNNFRSQSSFRNNYRGRYQNRKILRNFSPKRYSRSNGQNNQYRSNYSRPNSNRSNYSIYTIYISNSPNRYYSRYYTKNTIETKYNQTTEIHSNNRPRNDSNNRPYYNQIDNRSRDNSRKGINNYPIRQKNISQSTHIKDNLFEFSQEKTLNQTLPVLTTDDDPPGID